MNGRIIRLSLIASVLTPLCLASSIRLMAQDTTTQKVIADDGVERNSVAGHRRYRLKDLGTLGGPASVVGFFVESLNNKGTVAGVANTANRDPFTSNCFTPNCFVQHGFKWESGVRTDLGTLPGGSSSGTNAINEAGQIAGQSQNGLIDPLTGIPATSAVLWKRNGDIVNLGTLGGDQGLAVAINNGGQVVGAAADTIPVPFSLANVYNLGFGTQSRAFLWQGGVMRDLGTLGGPEAFAQYVNDRGQVAGISYTNSTPNDTTGIPTVHVFLWEKGRITDLGSLGGTIGQPNDINSRGQVVGDMTLFGDESQHPFFWDRGQLTDLGTFGGSNGDATWLNDAGEVVGWAYFPGDQVRHAFVWRHGVKKDLGPASGDKCSVAYGINSEGQVVGTSGVCHGGVHALLWEDGATIDLNTVIAPNSGLRLVYALSVNDSGEIAGLGVPSGVSVADVGILGHAFLLIPIDRDVDNATKADFATDERPHEVGQDDDTGTTSVLQNGAPAGYEKVVRPPSGPFGEDPISVTRYGRLSRLPLVVRRRL